MTPAQRRTLETFAARDRPLNKAIAAALEEIDRLEAENQQLKAGRGSFRRLIQNLRKAHEAGEQ